MSTLTSSSAKATPLPSLEIHIPISANELFFNMVHYLVHSLRRFGGPYADAKVVLTIGEPIADPDLPDRIPWLNTLGIEVRWVDPEDYIKHSYFATGLGRLLHDFESEMVIMLDADILVASPFTDMVTHLHSLGAAGGVIAHVPPLPEFDYWQQIYDRCELARVEAKLEHTGWGYMFSDEMRRYCPPYFNLGVFCAPSSIMRSIGQNVFELLPKIDEVCNNIYRSQIAVSLAITKLNIEAVAVPPRYNFPNLMSFEAMYPDEARNASIVHILGNGQGVDKKSVFASIEHIEILLARNDLRCTNSKIQEILAEIHPQVVADRSLVSPSALDLWKPHLRLAASDNETTALTGMPPAPSNKSSISFARRARRKLKHIICNLLGPD